MTRRFVNAKVAQSIKMQLVEIIRDHFTNDGQVITQMELAREHVRRNASVTAAQDVQVYGGPAVVYLRNREGFAIVPITGNFAEFESAAADNTLDEVVISNAVAGLGAGGTRIGWYHPMSKDDWLWVYYIGHLGGAGIAAVFHAAKQVDENPRLTSRRGLTRIAARAAGSSPVSPAEKKVLEARLAP